MDARILASLQIVNSEYGRDSVRVTDLAKAVNLSVSRFSHLFTAEIDMSPARYIRVVRMKAASSLLTNTFLSIKEVAATVGVNGHASFCRTFKQSIGETPTAVRKFSKELCKTQAADSGQQKMQRNSRKCKAFSVVDSKSKRNLRVQIAPVDLHGSQGYEAT